MASVIEFNVRADGLVVTKYRDGAKMDHQVFTSAEGAESWIEEERGVYAHSVPPARVIVNRK